MLLEEASRDRNNNLNFIRFIAAVMVVICHAEPLSRGGQGAWGYLGSLAVSIFFFYSGFLLNRSVHKDCGAYEFFKARCIRIFPPLIVVVFVSVFVLGVCLTKLSVTEYFVNGQTYEYLLNAILVLKHNLPGVFEQNIYNATVNGSLWTLPVECLCYIVCWFMWCTGLSKDKVMKFTIPAFAVGYILMHSILSNIPLLISTLRPCGMFYCGILFDTYRRQIHLKLPYVMLGVGGLVLSGYMGVAEYGSILFLPYLLSYLAFGTRRKLNAFGEKHEISYGMYLCAWPVQQTVVMLHGGSMDPVLNLGISIPFILAAGYTINVLIEKPVMKRFRKS